MTVDPPIPSAEADWLALAVRTAHVAVGVSRLADGAFVDVNDAFCRLFRLRRDQVLGRTSAELGIWPEPAQRERMLELIRRSGGVSAYEARYRNADGELGDLQISARIIQHGGQGFLVGFLTDVTDRRELIEGLRATQARLDVALRSSGMLVFGQDRALRYTWIANPTLGFTEAELRGRTDEDLLGADIAQPLVDIKRRVLQSGRPERADVWVGARGARACYDLVVEPERDAAGRVVGIVCAAQDITARIAGGPDLAALRRRMQATITAIRGLADLVEREPLGARQGQRLRRIEQVAREAVPGLGPTGDAAAPQRLRERHAGAPVLVADGNPVLREQVAALLEAAGLRVAVAGNGVQAFSLAVQLMPRVVLLDMELPQRGGVAAARAIRTSLATPVPIIAMVSADPPEGAARALDAELDDIVSRPVPAERLYDKLLAWLDAG